MQQHGFAYRFDWGMEGLRSLAPMVDVVIVVDVLRFSSAVCAAVEGGSVAPHRVALMQSMVAASEAARTPGR